jgi:hypothetical protein
MNPGKDFNKGNIYNDGSNKTFFKIEKKSKNIHKDVAKIILFPNGKTTQPNKLTKFNKLLVRLFVLWLLNH